MFSGYSVCIASSVDVQRDRWLRDLPLWRTVCYLASTDHDLEACPHRRIVRIHHLRFPLCLTGVSSSIALVSISELDGLKASINH